MGLSVIDRFWHLSDVLEDREISMTWRLRVMIAHDVAKQIKMLHQGTCSFFFIISCWPRMWLLK